MDVELIMAYDLSNLPPKARVIVASLALGATTLVGIAGYESYRGDAYLPTPHDVPTYGYGSTKGVKLGDKITPDRALARLANDLDSVYVIGVKKCVDVPLYDHEFGAYVSLTYNIGVPAFCNSTLVKKLNHGDYSGACAEISRWNKQKGKELKGLTKRRSEERKICEGKV